MELPAGLPDIANMMMVYDQQRRFNIQIAPGNCAEYAKLHRAVMSGGVGPPGIPGRKAYVNCFLKKGMLHVLAHELLPVPSW
mmetsp:Transcript_25675/g.68668  ORF Transcript_25675/g.68668 Transcript_25675/m.68668 type:complete len:82 (-) Transcript_25675:137-382(-)